MIVLVLAGVTAPSPVGAAAPVYSDDTAVVGFEPSFAGEVDALIRSMGASIMGRDDTIGFAVVRTDEPAAFIERIQGTAGISYAERDLLVFPEHTPNDLAYGQQWGMRAINANVAWDTQKGAGAVIAVLDTGVDWTHPDLALSIWLNVDEILDGIDNDGNGYVDDIHGWDFSENNNDPHPGACGDHGTHVAGIVAAQQDNVLGVTGVAPQAKVMPLRMLCGGGSTLGLAALAVAYAANNGADIVTCSWFAGPASTAFEATVTWAYTTQNVLFVKSAGNQNGGVVTYPGTLPEYIAVSSINADFALSSFSSQGTKVELTAPGGSIYSTYTGSWASLSGTSMAAPHVAGTAALLFAEAPGVTNLDVRAALAASAKDLGAAGRDTKFGHGLVNASAALTLV